MTPAHRTPTCRFFAPRLCARDRSEQTIFVPSTEVICTSITLPTWVSSIATAASFPDVIFLSCFFLSRAFSKAGAVTTGATPWSSSSSSKLASGAVTVNGDIFRAPFSFSVRLEAICDNGRNARNRPLNTRKINPPRFATSTRPETGSPFSNARVSAFFASAFFESSFFLPPALALSFVTTAAAPSVSPTVFSPAAFARTPPPRDANTTRVRRAVAIDVFQPDETRAGARGDTRAAAETPTHCARVDAMVSTLVGGRAGRCSAQVE
mmetsp:Transcript_14034/g.52628  ORF Transcript_14034/g.52628 Transcript_14034/m.52628 type:complete len:266 (+) Transcript_14034:664-1461(+)